MSERDRRARGIRRAHEDLARRVADCLEEHLHEYGWKPYRYRPSSAHPEGEHKGIHAEYHIDYSTIDLIGADGSSYVLMLARRHEARS